MKNKHSYMTFKNKTEPGRYSDGGGLYLVIRKDGSKAWVFRWRDRVTGKLRDKGLGPFWDVTLEEARAVATTCRRQIREGINPIDAAREKLEADRRRSRRRIWNLRGGSPSGSARRST
ncbi:Arm DNA-binding domain-containing protein [Rhodanobacter lindaniclasticus]